MIYKIAKIIRWICVILLAAFLVFFVLVCTKIIIFDYEKLRKLYYVVLCIWLVATLTKFVKKKDGNNSQSN